MDSGYRTRPDENWAKKESAVSGTRSYSGNGYIERVYTVCELSVGGCLITRMYFFVLFPSEKVVEACVKA